MCGLQIWRSGDVVVVDGNGVVVVPMAQSAVILEQALSGTDDGESSSREDQSGRNYRRAVNVDEVFKSAFSYQKRAVERG